jgi:hypothetical protein
MKTYNKVIIIVGVLILITLKVAGAGNAETVERWVFDPRVNIYLVDKVDDEWRYDIYYCIDDQYIVTLERDMWRNTGWITLYEDGIGISYQSDWGGEEESRKIINNLVSEILNASE